MRIMLDTNVVMSALMFPDSVPAQAMLGITEKYKLVLCQQIISELRNKIAEKRPDLLYVLNELLEGLEYEIAEATTPSECQQINDPKDSPILNAALSGNVNVIVSGDKHFTSLNLEKLETLSPAEFLYKYGS